MSGAVAGSAVVSGGRCSTCDTELTGPFCYRCGEPRSHHGDLALRHLLHDAVHEFTHVDGKIWRTIRALIVEPGRLTKEYHSRFLRIMFLLYRRRQRYFGAHMILAMHFYSFENVLPGVMAPVNALVAQSIRPVFILIPVAYIFFMLRRIFGEKAWLTWANGHWSR
jgi:uncharacterized protein DUF3667